MEHSPAQPTVPAIQMEDVAFGSLQDVNATVAEQVHWTVDPGQFWVIAGLQGSGKSDFLMMAAGLMAPQRGRYWLFGEEMPIFDEARLHARLRLGLVFDGGQLFNHLTVRENVALPLRYHRNLTLAEAEPEVRVLLESMELMPWADSTPGAIGRNWRKRVGLARALALKPEVLLVDNPLAGLDLRHVHWWQSFLDQLSNGHSLTDGRPLALAVTTADLRLWQNRACRFAVLRNQRFIPLGSWKQLETEGQELVRELLMTETRSD